MLNFEVIFFQCLGHAALAMVVFGISVGSKHVETWSMGVKHQRRDLAIGQSVAK